VKRWALCVRIALAVVAVANLVGLAGNIAGAAVYARATKLCETASLNFADNSTIDGSSNCVLANHEVQLANFTVSVQALCEAAVLLLIVAGCKTASPSSPLSARVESMHLPAFRPE